MHDVETKVRDLLHERLGEIDPARHVPDLTARVRRRRALVGTVWVASACVVIAGVVSLWLAFDPSVVRRDGGPVDSPEHSADEIKAALSSIDEGWTHLPDPPFASFGAHGLWTGQGLVLLGGETHTGFPSHEVALYDPVDRVWEQLADVPVEPASVPVWTGEEVLVWGPHGGAALDPPARTWRSLPDTPAQYGNHLPSTTVWTGTEMIVWGDRNRTSEVTNGAAYNPATDSWRVIADAPFPLNSAEAVWTDLSVWDDKKMFVFGSHLGGSNIANEDYAQALTYDPDADRWREVPLPAGTASATANDSSSLLSPQASSAAWTGTHVLMWDYDLSAVAYDPFEDLWVTLPKIPLRFSECYPSSAAGETKVMAWFCGQAALFESADFTWTKLDPPDDFSAQPTAVDDIFFLPGATADMRDVPKFYVYKPPA